MSSNILSDWVKKNVQKPEKGDLESFLNRWYSVIAEPKIDGRRVFLWSGLQGKRYLASKHNGVYTEHDYPDLFKELIVPQQSIFDCELVHQKSTLYIFDVLYYQNMDVRAWHLSERKQLLRFVLGTQHVVILQGLPVSNLKEAEDVFQTVVEGGGEGVVYKADVAYGTLGSWLKRRATETEDLFVTELVATDTTKETGEFVTYMVAQYDSKGAVKVIGKVSSAMSTVDRDEIKVGSVLEVRFNYVDGQRVFPGTICSIRTDKIASECVEASGYTCVTFSVSVVG
jgi:ATP-dependent DNA ligase